MATRIELQGRLLDELTRKAAKRGLSVEEFVTWVLEDAIKPAYERWDPCVEQVMQDIEDAMEAWDRRMATGSDGAAPPR